MLAKLTTNIAKSTMKDSKQTMASDADPNSISIDAARKVIFEQLPSIQQTQTVPVLQAFGRVLAVDLTSAINVPSFRASAMDGYAYRHTEAELTLRIADTSLAGHPSADDASAGECHRITTGARVPDFADTVVQQENVEIVNGSITIKHGSDLGHHVRPIGSDSAKDQPLMSKGQRIGAAQIATLCAHGMSNVEVIRPINVAVFSTGDELNDAGTALPVGNIYDANRALLASMLGSSGVVVNDLGIVKDSISALEDVFERCRHADMVISSGGVSVGDADFVRPVLERLGKLHVWKIAVKPGRPLTFGKLDQQQPYFGLPGNPVSAAVTALLFVQPAIRKMLGQASIELPRILATLNSTLKKLPGRVEYQRALLEQDDLGNWSVSTTGLQDSHVVSSLHKANCFIELGFDSKGAQAGEKVTVIPFAHFADPVL